MTHITIIPKKTINHPKNSEWIKSKAKRTQIYPHLVHSWANPPDRSGHPFFHSCTQQEPFTQMSEPINPNTQNSTTKKYTQSKIKTPKTLKQKNPSFDPIKKFSRIHNNHSQKFRDLHKKQQRVKNKQNRKKKKNKQTFSHSKIKPRNGSFT